MNNYDDIINLNRPISKHQHLGIDSVNEIIKFSDNNIIKMNDVINISSDIFNSIFEK